MAPTNRAQTRARAIAESVATAPQSPGLRLRPAHTISEEAALRDYLRDSGTAVFYRSATLLAIRRLETECPEGEELVPCDDCGGWLEQVNTWACAQCGRELPHAEKNGCPKCRGKVVRGRVPHAGKGYVWADGRAMQRAVRYYARLHGISPEDLGRIKAIEAELLREGLSPLTAGCSECDTCHGLGWVPNRARRLKLTAQPTGSSRPVSDYHDASEQQIGNVGRIGRLLTALHRRAGGRACQALVAYYSPDGGSLADLWHLVAAGRQLLRDNPLGLPLPALVASVRLAAENQPSTDRQLAFAEADRQAGVLLGRTRRVWESVVAARREEERTLREGARALAAA